MLKVKEGTDLKKYRFKKQGWISQCWSFVSTGDLGDEKIVFDGKDSTIMVVGYDKALSVLCDMIEDGVVEKV